ncbi:MAG: DNA-binding domain-containing protein [Prevotella sp.]|nr:DNA-binding domain-containing protein [Prevotella sp.]
MKYTLVMRGNPRYPERGKKVCASAQYEKTLSTDELIDHIMLHGSSYRKGDYKAIISTLAEAMAEMMAEGYRIDLGEIGSFYPTLDCKGADTMADFDPDKHIKAVNVNWKPGDDFKNLKDKVTFREDLTRRMQKEALKADMERWNKEGE